MSIVTPVLDSQVVGTDGRLTGPWRNSIGDLYRWVGAGAWQSYTPACSAPGYAPSFAEYRVLEGEVEISSYFSFLGNGGYADVGLTLPPQYPAYRNFGHFSCCSQLGTGAITLAVALIYTVDGVIHISQPGGSNWPTGTTYIQLSGRYRTE